MRTLTVALFTLFCLAPLWAEEEIPLFEVYLEYLNQGVVRGSFTNQFFRFEMDQDLETEFTDSIFFGWLAYGQDTDSPYQLAIKIEPPMWESEVSRNLGHDPIRGDKYYGGFQYLTDWIDVRLFPLAISPQKESNPRPHLELRQWRVARLHKRIDLITRGRVDLESFDFAAGADLRLTNNFSGKVLYGTEGLQWSISFKTVINR